MKRLGLACWLLLAACGIARADPTTIGFIILSAIEAAGVTGAATAGTTAIVSVAGATITVAQIVGTVALIGATVGAAYGVNAFLNKAPSSKPQDGQITTRQPVPPRRRGYGRIKIGGALMLSETTTVAGVVARFQVSALHHGEIDAFEEHWFSEFPAVLNGGGEVINHYTLGATPFIRLDTRRGLASETAFGAVVAALPALWSNAHRGDGIASAMVLAGQPPNAADLTTVYPGGLPPPYRAVVRASKVWDPRDGTQDKDAPSTWKWRSNPVLIALDFHRHADGLGLAAYDDTLFTTAAITGDWIPAANICDETIAGAPRYTCSGLYSLPEDEPASVLAAILATCDGAMYQRHDGAIGIRVGKTIAPTVTLDDKHILGYEGFRKGDNVFLACNEVTAKYTSPDHDYQETDAQPWRDEADITDRGQVLSKPLALQWVTSHSQARRLMKLAIYRFNPEWSGRIVTDMAGLAAFNERYIHLTISEGGLALVDGDFEITSFDIIIGESLTCSIGVSSLGQSAFNWDEGTEAGTPPPVPAGVMGS